MIKVAILEYENESMEVALALSKIYAYQDWTFRHFTKASDLARRLKEEEYQLFVFDEVFKTPRLESVFVHDHPNSMFVYLCENPIRTKGNDQRHRVLYLDKGNIRQEVLQVQDQLLSLSHQMDSYELNYDGVHVFLPYPDIYYLDKMEKMIYFHTKKGEFHERANMSDLEKVFTPYGFLRVHVSYLVKAIHIVAWYKDEVELDNGDRIPLSRQQKRKILALKKSNRTLG